jgi:dTDP-4-amino-4,6-dideoxygalactose transaminase
MKFIDLQAQSERVKLSIEKRISEILDSAHFINGPTVTEFEISSAKYLGYKYGIGVASGTDALLVTLMALNVGPNTRVFLPAYTYTATAEVVCLLGATPVFIDVDINSFLINPSELRSALDTHSKPGDVVMTVDLFGEPCDYDVIAEILNDFSVELIIDGAQSFGCSYKGKSDIAITRAFCTSFFPAKPLGCAGDGGAIYTSDEEFAIKCKSIKNHGMGQDKYDIKRIGLNARLDTVQAAVLIEKMSIFNSELNEKTALHSMYKEKLKDVLHSQTVDYQTQSALAQSVFRIPDNSNMKNYELQSRLHDKAIPSMIYYPKTVADQTAYSKDSIIFGELQVSRYLCERTIALPMHAYLNENDVNRIIDSILICLDAN